MGVKWSNFNLKIKWVHAQGSTERLARGPTGACTWIPVQPMGQPMISRIYLPDNKVESQRKVIWNE